MVSIEGIPIVRRRLMHDTARRPKRPVLYRQALFQGFPGARDYTNGRAGKQAGEQETGQAILVRPGDGDCFDFGGLGVHWKLDGILADQRFSIVHHPMAPHALAAPLHRHRNEDEYSYVLEGTLGALLGDDAVTAGPGSWVIKRRHQWHTFWNAGDTPCTIIEIISPAGFENYFREVAAAWGNLEQFARINQKYSLQMDFDSVPLLCQRFGLTFPNLRSKAELGV
jgi:mannose-6-phosphate isomerase-like protein (cupin superfamily)